jgi:hypothetical protein
MEPVKTLSVDIERKLIYESCIKIKKEFGFDCYNGK